MHFHKWSPPGHQSTYNQFRVCFVCDFNPPIGFHLVEDVEITGAATMREWNQAVVGVFSLSRYRCRLILANNRLRLLWRASH